jgi:hypothetical protein
MSGRAIASGSMELTRYYRFDITPNGQQVHIAYGTPSDFVALSSRHPCFRVESAEALSKLQSRVWEHFERGGPSAPVTADKPGESISGMSMRLFNMLCEINFVGDLGADMRFGWIRDYSFRYPEKILRSGLCWQSTRIQLIDCRNWL